MKLRVSNGFLFYRLHVEVRQHFADVYGSFQYAAWHRCDERHLKKICVLV
jgi:hypothetical protein